MTVKELWNNRRLNILIVALLTGGFWILIMLAFGFEWPRAIGLSATVTAVVYLFISKLHITN